MATEMNGMVFNENARVKIPAILHLCRLGYSYLPLSKAKWDPATNIFTEIFAESMQRLHPGMTADDLQALLRRIHLALDNEDLGRAFHEMLTQTSGHTLIDFDDFSRNQLHVVTELPCRNGDEEFRPDITLLVNGLPLAFIEVKKPNNPDGIQAEYKRIQSRFGNKKFRKFIHITQLMVFSNNMEYAGDGLQPLQGAFYATPAYGDVKLNYFREEEEFDRSQLLSPESEETIAAVLKDNNLVIIRNAPEFRTNRDPDTPTHRICTSLFQPRRLAFLLQYAIAYVKSGSGLEKHVMRYPQLFATLAIRRRLDEGARKGIIWHTQGSGKTALAYYNVRYLTRYFSDRGTIPKFYFIVDRLDLLVQAGREFKARGLVVHSVQSRDEFLRDLRETTALHNSSGRPEITVVNIQKFQEDPDVVSPKDYGVQIQRVYFLDEVHRSYHPRGSFLANLNESDTQAIQIGLTGTPLLGKGNNSRAVFGDYIHKYYYNASIADGYTLRLIREEIETGYRFQLRQALEEIRIPEGEGDRRHVFAHPRFVEPLLDYILRDLDRSRAILGDRSIGAMVICDSSEQAERLQEIFDARRAASRPPGGALEAEPGMFMAAEPGRDFHAPARELSGVQSSALILHDAGTKEDREARIEEFKAGKIDILFVYNMLITGFDAPRLKKLYLLRKIKAHNLLQALTRVNRTYRNFKYGYVVDFADIQQEFDKTNRDYYDELRSELGDELQHYSSLFKTPEEIGQEIRAVQDVLARYDTANAEEFSRQISQINDRKTMQELAKALNDARDLYHLIRLSGHHGMLALLDFQKLTLLAREADHRLALINTREALANHTETVQLLNIALEEVVFTFEKLGEAEMVIADRLRDILKHTRQVLGGNYDPRDPDFISLKEELERLFKQKNLSETSKREMEANIRTLEGIHRRAQELERRNRLLREKYANDAKYARIHKRLLEQAPLKDSESQLVQALQGLKQALDEQIYQNESLLENEHYMEKLIGRLVVTHLKNIAGFPLDAERSLAIQRMVLREYMNEYNDKIAS
ncbi:MAG: hypothetical protein RLZZ165_683 [Bacteroidota bacterium]